MKYIFKNLLCRVPAVFMVLGIILTNCGFQGPLYLPKKPAPSATKTASGTAKLASSSPQNVK